MEIDAPFEGGDKPITITDDMVGSLYSQKYKEGKRIMEYDVEILEYLDASNEKGGNRFYPC